MSDFETSATVPTRRVEWAEGRWTHEPAAVRVVDDSLFVTAVESSDAWRHTAYGFVHDTEHALLVPFDVGTAVEVVVRAGFSEQFDQAGVFVRVDDENWVKAGLEFADGILGAGAVVTRGDSDWSVGAAESWLGAWVRVRVSRSAGALTVRAGIDGEPLRLLRVAPLPDELVAQAGPFVCAPTRAGLVVELRDWRVTGADASLH